MFGVSRTLCHRLYDNLPLGNIALQYMSFQTIAGRSDGVFWWFPALSEDQEKNCRIHQNYLVALKPLNVDGSCVEKETDH